MTKRKVKNMAMAYLFLLPNLVGFLIFTLIPIVCSMGLSFMEWDSANPMVFVGFENFKRLWTDDTFKISLWNTVYYSVFTVPLTMAAALGLAIILNQKMKGINIFRTIFFFPHVASLVAIAVVWNLLFHPTLGPVNNILRFLGIANPPGWTSSVDWAMPVIIIVSIWKSMGYYMILYLSGLQAIPRELYEAAKVDGANSFQRFKSITLPMLTPTTFFVSIMLTIACFKVFDLVSVMTNGGPGRATNVLVFNIYNTAFINYEFGYASAISMILFIIVLAITIVQFRAEKKWVSYM
ncbi:MULTISPECIES: carbohydrate ABC transporter permease [Clostridia]|uniref:carbohydrate ABC transporter permease n=1 Tax=Clostridia TaxID=186801 RepID=UPI000B7E4317|nr:sugar ABC transporter permease [Clostridium sp. WB02_MRS01]MBW4848445.1 sugar ABC transporter permease [Lachnospiraceae bacterium]MSS08995.1 sugar ABC transporter permease [Clostridium sp. WB02_MRS01]